MKIYNISIESTEDTITKRFIKILLFYQVLGGMLLNLYSQLSTAKQEKLYENLLTYALFPQVRKTFLENKNK
ncbi:hypothetical protein ACQRC6_02660 [Peptoniphilus sp. SGI.035]|uniref:hypothetical protein n=1 Tax=Peptoniphilus sp. SGI.035 TaxID=3420564 RepID=UPI003CFBF9AA